MHRKAAKKWRRWWRRQKKAKKNWGWEGGQPKRHNANTGARVGQAMHTKILVGRVGDENERQAKAEEGGGKQQGHKNRGRRETAKKTHTNKRSGVRERSTQDDKLLRRLAGHGALAHRTRFRFAPTNASYRIAHDPRAQFCRKHQSLSAPLPTVANTKQAGAPRCTFRTVWAPKPRVWLPEKSAGWRVDCPPGNLEIHC